MATTLAVLGPDALGGTGPVDRPLLGLDLLGGSTAGQCGALIAILMIVWTLAQRGAAAHRASVAAAAMSATLAQPLLNLIDELVMAASARLDSLSPRVSSPDVDTGRALGYAEHVLDAFAQRPTARRSS